MKKFYAFFLSALLWAGCSWATVNSYIFSGSSGPYTPISGGTVLGTTANDDHVFNFNTAPLAPPQTNIGFPIGFSFTYNEIVYDRFAVNTNGWILLGTGSFTIAGTTVPISVAGPAGFVSAIAPLGMDLQGQTGSELSFKTDGIAPNRFLTVQWSGYKSYGSSGSGDNFSFQIILVETTNEVRFVYGPFTKNTTTRTPQVGLRGNTNADFHNRTTTLNWAATNQGIVNNATCTLSPAVLPGNGLTFSFLPFYGVPNCAGNVSPADLLGNVTVTATLNWSVPVGGGTPAGYKLYFGTDNPPTNIVNGTNLGLVYTYDPVPNMNYLTPYFWRIVPTNAQGDAVGCPVWTFTTGPDPTIVSFPYCESFDDPLFAPYGWENIKTGGTGNPGTWDRQITGTNPTCLPRSGAGMARYNSYLLASGTTGILVTPPVNFPSDQYSVEFWMFRDSGYPTYSNELVNVYFNTSPLTSGATLLGTIHRYYGFSPIEATANQWYQYSFNIPAGGGGGGRYIVFEAVSQYGNNMFIDDVCLTVQPVQINAGEDKYIVSEGRIGFGTDYPVLPADFFGPGSDPFEGQVYFIGKNSNGGEEPFADVSVERMTSGSCDPPCTETIATEMTELQLVSSAPVMVIRGGGGGSQVQSFFDVYLEIDIPQSGGYSEIQVPEFTGGTFTTMLPVQPVFTFVNREDPVETYVYNPGAQGIPALQYSSTGPYPWTASPIQGEFDPDGDTSLRLYTMTGSVIDMTPLLIRENNNFNVTMNEMEVVENYSGNGFNGGQWFFYPNTYWWNVWWYDHRMKIDRRKYILTPVMNLLPRDSQIPSSVEIVYTYSTPSWATYPSMVRPPLPSDVPDPVTENQMIQRSAPIFQFNGPILQPISIPLISPYIIYPYNPEWISIDIRGYNFILNGFLNHVCFKKVTKAIDFGDAPAPYPTLLAVNGARHTIVAGVFMGNLLDGEPDGQPTPNANGDDLNNLADEDGVTWNTALTPGQPAVVTVKTSIANALLQVWIDFNADGDWTDPLEQVATNKITVAGNTVVNFVVPIGANSGATFARFRMSTMPNLTWEGQAPNGEVEDHKVSIAAALDFGDAKDPLYPTLLASNGARHIINPQIFLGSLIDAEPDGLQSFMATGDDNNNLDDEDGVIFTSTIIPGYSATVSVTASVAGFLHAWIDFNGNGIWGDPGDKIFSDVALLPGLNNLTFAVPVSAQTGNTYARFRFISVANPALSYTGQAPDGEVEDYYVAIISPTGDRRADPDPLGALVQNEISLAVIPGAVPGIPQVILAAYNDQPFPGGPGLGVAYSTDGGTMWNLKHMTYPIDPYSGIPFADAFDPTTVADGNHNLYVAHISTDYDWTNGPSSGLFVHKSSDNGASWTGPITVSTNPGAVSNPDPNYRFNDRCQMAVDLNSSSQYYNRLYVAWIKDRGWNMALPMSDIYFSWSSNGGLNWSPAVVINQNQNNMGNMPVPAVGNDGTVYVCWIDYNVQTGGTGKLFLNKSTDGGVTWQGTDQLIRNINLPPISLTDGTRAKGAAVIKTSPVNAGELYITFAENPGVPDLGNIYFIRSADFGVTWSTPLRVNDDQTFNDQVMPWMDVKPNGTIDIAWYDRRNDPANLSWDLYFSSSMFNGTLFSTNTRINDNSFVTPSTSVGKWMGEYPGLKTDSGYAYVAFTSSFFDSNGDILCDKIINPVIAGDDWGDAPDPRYPTYNASNGARHAIVPGYRLGTYIDPEPDGLSNWNTTGDDNNNLDDEDGVTVKWGNICGWPTKLNVNASASGLLDAWWDFGMNGWGDPGEQIFTSAPLAAGNNILNFVVPPYANRSGLPGYSSRFRFSQQGGLGYSGPASSGEVEDYQVNHGYADEAKWKQPADTDQVALHAHDGPTQHIILADDFLCWEGNITAIRWYGTYEANGSGINHFHLSIHNNGSGNCIVVDPEIWGMNVPLASAGQQSTGQTNGLGEVIYSYQYILDSPLSLVANGHYWLDISVVSNSPSNPALWKWQEYGRSHVPVICAAESKTITGGVPGPWTPIYWNVTNTYSDLAFQIISAMDFGDAPAPYPTLLTNNGACHGNDGIYYLGSMRDTEPNGQPSALADGDDNNPTGLDDEDGVTIAGNITPGGILQATVIMGTSGVLQGFVDFNADGDWSDSGEWVIVNQSLAAGSYILPIPIPPTATIGVTYARFRISTFSFDPSLTNTPAGYWPNGEVEDYRIQIKEMLEYGDAPDPGYPTLLASNGARHMNLGANIFMGLLKDFELDGQPNASANGDDMNNLADEDGVTFNTPLAQGQPAIITVVANIPNALLQGWIDFNTDGDWADGGEQIATNVNTVSGANTINFTVPLNALTGITYARFRISTMPNLSFNGVASNGEVEDYTVTILPAPDPDRDFGDAPSPYPTKLINDGARHTNTGLKLGALIDVEADGQPNAGATGDDNNPPGLNDEDGIWWPFTFVPGQGNTIRVTTSGPGFLNAWIDFNNNGAWEEPAEKVFSGQALAAGVTNLSVFVPATTPFGNIYGRFRFSSAQNLAQTGLANDGEVEDYAFPVNPAEDMDYGDAPDSYGTLAASNGARHDNIGPNVFMGVFRDLETDGQPNVTASGDDVNPAGGADDEDGVVFSTPLVPSQVATLTITVNLPGGFQEGWIDFNSDGDFLDGSEHIIINSFVVNLVTAYIVNVPAGAQMGQTYARFRYSTQQNVPSFGPTANGEVEDYMIYIGQYDLGDAPDPGYPTTLARNGAIHKTSPLILGWNVDAEPDGQPHPNALGDDNSGGIDDEDGVVFDWPLTKGNPVKTTVVASLNTGFLQGWIDFNADGDWDDPDEQVFTDLSLKAGTNDLHFFVPVSATTGMTFARFRFSTQQGLSYNGPAPDGEVEDYEVEITANPDHKWHQFPDVSLPGLHAHDAMVAGVHQTVVLADDWLCNGGMVTDIHWWGNYEMAAGGIEQRGAGINHFHLSIHNQVGTQCLPSDPEVWSATVVFTPTLEQNTGLVNNEGSPVYLYEYMLTVPYEQIAGEKYWVDITAWSNDPNNPPLWRWQEAMRSYDPILCGAANKTLPNPGIWSTIIWNNFTPPKFSDMAFVITSGTVISRDWGDLPDQPYPTVAASNGPNHILGNLFLGNNIDAELNGQPHLSALGDDNNNLDDDDGVTLPPFIKRNKLTSVTFNASQNGGLLQGWIDYNGDGDFNDSNEQIFADQPLAMGNNTLSFTVDPAAKLGATFARFRISTVAGLSYTGPAPDGEVEDYKIFILDTGESKMHWPQYPDLNPTGMDVELTWVTTADDFLCTETGPVNTIRIWGSFFMDQLPEPLNSEPIRLQLFTDIPAGNVQPWSMPGDLLWSKIYLPGQYTATIVSTNSPEWWYDPAYQTAIPNNHQIVVRFDFDLGPEPFVQTIGTIYWLEVKRLGESNFGWKTADYNLRFNDDAAWFNDNVPGWIEHVYPPAHPWAGQSFDMAFEINPPVIINMDYGDAHDLPYPTLFASNGARHVLDGLTWLGASVDTDPDGQPDPVAMGDDNDELDDEDGVTFMWPLLPGSPCKLGVVASVGDALFNGWIDYNHNGFWGDPGEQIYFDLNLAAGNNLLTFIVPGNALAGPTFARFRFSHQPALSFIGQAFDGEVEDYMVEISEEGSVKWQQLPDPSQSGLHSDQTVAIADDWKCFGGILTDVHWWGNYELDAQNNEERGQGINHFLINIYSNANCLPGAVLKTYVIQWNSITEVNTGMTGIDGSPVYYYEVILPEPFMQETGSTYWISIQAISNNPNPPFNAVWRWEEANRWFYPILCGAASSTPTSPWMTIFWPWPEPGKYSDMAFVITSVEYKTLNLKVYLEGLYAGSGFMNKAQDEFGDHFPGNTADQIRIELHNEFDYTITEYYVDNVDLNTSGDAQITGIPNGYSGNYYLTIIHRNSIETTSADPVPFSPGIISYDFTDAASRAYGDNQKDLGDGNFAIWGADVNQDDLVDGGDMNEVDNAVTAITFGYVPEDVNGDGIVDGTDINMVDNNSTMIIMAYLP